MEDKEVMETVKENEPVFFVSKRVSLVSDFAGILSWVVLVGFLGNLIVQVVSLQSQLKASNLVFSTVIKEISFISYLFVNLAIPFLTGLGIFALLQAAAAGLNILLENDFNSREAKSAESA